jgi:hypothetical protein
MNEAKITERRKRYLSLANQEIQVFMKLVLKHKKIKFTYNLKFNLKLHVTLN